MGGPAMPFNGRQAGKAVLFGPFVSELLPRFFGKSVANLACLRASLMPRPEALAMKCCRKDKNRRFPGFRDLFISEVSKKVSWHAGSMIIGQGEQASSTTDTLTAACNGHVLLIGHRQRHVYLLARCVMLAIVDCTDVQSASGAAVYEPFGQRFGELRIGWIGIYRVVEHR